jgi:hypothetical protein
MTMASIDKTEAIMSQENSISNGVAYHPIRKTLEDGLTPDVKRQKTGFNVRYGFLIHNQCNCCFHDSSKVLVEAGGVVIDSYPPCKHEVSLS